ncbi:HD domain-containing phosphohydrolase [Lysinibacillus sp. BW-2-10]|uniref:HD domain-containing phosphohydrolase n=1 Tax=Lysinibacillus sp. BW-2-10 TaxID=2590030 RepID=UPI00117CD5DD|nr:HD domain-containing phosphohydrolase [Lysinibacillus sp. BW-2-10]TSI11017.1 DUF3369 domain-containing protein [Lysinibacillus sp. BW-2-10]
MDSKSLFKEDNEQLLNDHKRINHWHVLIVNQDKKFHQFIEEGLKDIAFEQKGITWHHAYSSIEAKQILCAIEHMAVILLDTELESMDSGLQIVQYIRNELHDQNSRIILQTSHPETFPYKQVMLSFEINDYQIKSELTSYKLFTSIISALRSYRELLVMEQNKNGLKNVISATSEILKEISIHPLIDTILGQLKAILKLQNTYTYGSLILQKSKQELQVLFKSGVFQNKLIDTTNLFSLSIRQGLDDNLSLIESHTFLMYLGEELERHYFIYFNVGRELTDWEKKLIEIFSSQTSTTFKNVCLVQEIDRTQREIIYTLGEIGEMRSKEIGNHVKRVAEYSRLLALKYGLSEEEAEIIQLASPMHDIGKVGISDIIMNKPDKLTDEEYEVMKSHSLIGFNMLKHSERPIIKAAAVIAHQHHEKYNGTGYPQGIKGEQIHLYGRITAIADVFDALVSDRVYKKGWEMQKIIKYFKEERGKHFDPKLTDIFLANLDAFLKIKDETD